MVRAWFRGRVVGGKGGGMEKREKGQEKEGDTKGEAAAGVGL